MSLFKDNIKVELYKYDSDSETINIEGFRNAQRQVLKMMGDIKSNVRGASFYREDGSFLKEIVL